MKLLVANVRTNVIHPKDGRCDIPRSVLQTVFNLCFYNRVCELKIGGNGSQQRNCFPGAKKYFEFVRDQCLLKYFYFASSTLSEKTLELFIYKFMKSWKIFHYQLHYRKRYWNHYYYYYYYYSLIHCLGQRIVIRQI